MKMFKNLMSLTFVSMLMSFVPCLFSMENNQIPKARLKQIIICNDDKNCVMRTVWVPEDAIGWGCTVKENGKIVEPASDAIHKEAAIIQKKLGLNHGPALVYPSIRSLGHIRWFPDFAVVQLGEDLLKEENAGMRQFVEGHEAGHLLVATHERSLARRDYYSYKKIAEVSVPMGTIAAVTAISVPKRVPVVRPAFGVTSALYACFYGIARGMGEHYADILHNEELECDRIPVERLADTPEEKIAMAQNGIDFFQKFSEDRSYSARRSRLIFPITHPSNERRIAQQQKIIYQQQEIIKNKKNQKGK